MVDVRPTAPRDQGLENKMSKVITYQAPGGATLDMTPAQIEICERAGKWPRCKSGASVGQEYCTVSHGLHDGSPDMTDDDLRADLGLISSWSVKINGGHRVGWDSVYASRADAEALAARARKHWDCVEVVKYSP